MDAGGPPEALAGDAENEPADATPRGALIANLLAQLAFGLLAMTICLPSMQQWGSIFGASQAAVQLTFSAYVVAYGGLQLVYGPLSDQFGRKKILIAGIALAGIGSLLAAAAPDLTTLTLARLVQGAGSAAGMVVGRAMVQDSFEGPERTRVMAYMGMVLGLCPPFATIVGGQLHVRFGWQANFLLMAAFAAALLLAAWRGLPDHHRLLPEARWAAAIRASYVRLVHEPVFLLYVTLAGMTTATFYVFLAGAPLVLGGFGVGPESIGYYIMVVPLSYIVGNYLTSRLIQRCSSSLLMGVGQVVTLGGIVSMTALAMAGLDSPLAFALPLIMLGLGHGILVPPVLVGTVSLIPALAGSAAAVAGLTQQMMGALGGFVVGLVEHDGATNLGLLMLACAGCASVALLLLESPPIRGRR